jgi:hypothetical protein
MSLLNIEELNTIFCSSIDGSTYCMNIPVNPSPLHGSLPRKSLISCMDWVSRAGDINLLHTPFPPARSPPTKKLFTFFSRHICLQKAYIWFCGSK